MSQANVISSIYTDLGKALMAVIESKYMYFGGRPDNIKADTKIDKFIVIELPVSIEDIAAGRKKFVLNTTGVFYLFNKAKSDMTLNLTTTSQLIADVEALFPIVGDYCKATNPKVLMRGADGYGYQVTTITFDLMTKANVFNQE